MTPGTRHSTDITTTSPRRTAVVDLGSNTFRLVVFERVTGGGHRLVDEFRETVRLSAGSASGRLTDEAIERAGRTASAYARFCRAAGIEDIVAIATSAIREADNGDEALAAIQSGGLRARIVDAREEARLGYLGAVNSTTLTDGHILDVGGGSAQVTRVQGRRMVATLREPLGAGRMTEAYFADGRIRSGRRAKLADHVRAALGGHDWLDDDGGRLVGIGGSVRTLASMAARREDDPLRLVHGRCLRATQIEDLLAEMSDVEPAKRYRIAGLKHDRADIMPAAAVVIHAVMEAVGAEEIEVCGQGLREGALWAHLYPDDPVIDGVRRHWVENLAVLHGADRAHAERVARLAGQIYEGAAAAGLQEPDDQERSLLWAAAQLHDIGTSIDYHDHHKHSQYLVMSAGLPGHDLRELTLIGRLVRSHRKRLPGNGGDPHMTKSDVDLVRRLAACLRIAEQLERDRAGTIHAVDVTREKKTLELIVHSAGDASLALWAAARETDAVQAAFGCELRLASAD